MHAAHSYYVYRPDPAWIEYVWRPDTGEAHTQLKRRRNHIASSVLLQLLLLLLLLVVVVQLSSSGDVRSVLSAISRPSDRPALDTCTARLPWP